MKAFFRINPRRLWVQYAIALTLLTLLISASYTIHLQTIRAGELDASIINRSGQQRMLSQRTLLLASKLVDQGLRSKPELLEAFQTTLQAFESNHSWLMQNAMTNEAAQEHYLGQNGAQLNTKSGSFIALGKTLPTALENTTEAASLLTKLEVLALDAMLIDLNAAVTIFEEAAQLKTKKSTNILKLSVGLTIALLFLEAGLIFVPAQRAVSRAFNLAERRQKTLDETNKSLRATSEKLEFSASHDQLTGLANRNRLLSTLEQMLTDPSLDVNSICLLHVDLDKFKEVNDTLGHGAGDAVLRRVASAMQTAVRDADVVARVGGDEFIIVAYLPEAEKHSLAQQIADRLIKRISEPMQLPEGQCDVGASVGYTFASEEMRTPDIIIGNADLALYEAKRDGRGQALRFCGDMREGLEQRRKTLEELTTAIDDAQIGAFIQPKIDAQSGTVLGFEALSRWSHPTRGIVLPADFISFAESAGMIEDIDTLVHQDALDMLVQLRRDGFTVPSMALNVSSHSLRRKGFSRDLIRMVSDRGLSPKDVVIEVLESTLIQNRDDLAARSIDVLSRAGVAIHMDDFGTGYASLSTLTLLSFSGLKIDRSLIRDLGDPKQQQVIKAIRGLAQGLSLDVIAEGIETEDQMTLATQLGCTGLQGFKIARPMSLDQTRVWLEETYADQQLDNVVGLKA